MQTLHWKPTNQAAAFLLNPGEIYWEGVNEYLAKTSHHEICFGYETVHFLRGLSDAYFEAEQLSTKINYRRTVFIWRWNNILT